jgi:uncharacterized protein (DUF427 family)
MSANSGPGYAKRPDYRIATKPAGVRVRVTYNGDVIADTRDAIRMDEGSYPAVYYIPRKDVRMDRLVRTAHTTHCPYKGHASYYTLSSGGKTAENAVWSYETPYDEMSVIKELLAFYSDRVDSIIAEPG